MSTEEITDSQTEPNAVWVNQAPISGWGSLPQFFTYPGLTQCLDLLLNLTENTDLIPLVKGRKGAGKTTLLYQYQAQADEHWSLCRIDANPMLHPEQLYHRLAQHVGIAEENDQFKDYLLRHLAIQCLDGFLPVLVIDDAHLLPVDTVAELLQLQAVRENNNPIIHIVLFAAPGIDDLLQAADPHHHRSHVIQTLDIPALTYEQATDYTTQVLAARGALEAFTLTPGEIEKIYRASQGNPGRIESLLHNLPAHPTTPQDATGRISIKLLLEDLPIPLILGSIALIVAILALLIFQQDINAVFNSSQSENQQTPTPPVVLQEIALELPADKKIQPEPVAKLATIEESVPVREILEEEPVAEPKEILPAEKIVAIEPIKQPPPSAKPKASIKREQWLLAQKSSAYTLQLIGLQDEASIRAFIKRHRLQGKAAYFKATKKGQPWFALLYGAYPNRKTAVSARSKLPKRLRRADIWIRSLESVQTEIHAQ
ncbi:hypothetical protein MNBD_GAMMA26-175 [hydrothermal vent metagenome]|uniref:SPOR domain-containing protein n=1 Tax=hydrothermal vent metagenome TaxID=652676 RepID=A0A3B1C0H4_9ZZZZ